MQEVEMFSMSGAQGAKWEQWLCGLLRFTGNLSSVVILLS